MSCIDHVEGLGQRIAVLSGQTGERLQFLLDPMIVGCRMDEARKAIGVASTRTGKLLSE